jgi:hypothetical protein
MARFGVPCCRNSPNSPPRERRAEMLKLLLDEHISPAVAEGLLRRNRWLTVSSMTTWERGEFLGRQDSKCLDEAEARGFTFVT